MNKLLAAAALGATALSTVAIAMQTAPPARTAKADTNADGALSRAEFVARAQARFDRLDADKNGQVTREERRTAHAGSPKHHAGNMRGGRMGGDKMLERLDTDRDGRVSRAEYDAITTRMSTRATARGVAPADLGKRVEVRFTRLDANKDGYIDAAERAAMPKRPHHPAPGPTPPSRS